MFKKGIIYSTSVLKVRNYLDFFLNGVPLDISDVIVSVKKLDWKVVQLNLHYSTWDQQR